MMRRGGWVGTLFGVLVAVGGPEAAGAQPAPTRADDPARVSFEQGMVALQANRPADAVRAFEDSYQRRPVAIVQYNLALAYRALGRNVDALTAFERFLREPGGVAEAQLRAVRREVEALRAGLAGVRLMVRPAVGSTVTVDGRAAVMAGGVLWLQPGRHALEVSAAGHRAQQRVEEFRAGAEVSWEVTLEAERVAAPTMVAPLRVDDGRDRQRVGLETVRPREGGEADPGPVASGRPGWVVPVVVTASVLVAAGIGVGVWALLREPGVELPATTTGWTVQTIGVGP